MNRRSTARHHPEPTPGPARSAHLRRRLADQSMVGLARLLVHVFFRRVEVEHGERITDRPTVLVASHRNGLVDGLLVMAALRRTPRFLGKSTLFRNPLLWPFLKLGGVVPVHRAQDGASEGGNASAFAMSTRVLAERGMVAIFPEGISHDRPALQPLRTGAARIALGAADDGIVGVETVAVALVYDDKQTFRSRALVRVGVPQPVARWMDQFRADEHRAVRLLTDDLAGRLRQVGPDVASWCLAGRLAEVADIVARQATVLPGEVGLVSRQQVVVALAEGNASPDRRRERERLRVALAAYRQHLTLIGLEDAQVTASYRSGRLRWTFVAALAKVIVALPVAAAGFLIHVVPYQVVKRASRIPTNDGMRATVKLLGCFFLFTLSYAGIGVVVGEAHGAPLGLLAAVAAPVFGYVTVSMVERIRRMGGAVAGYRAVRDRGSVVAMVLADRSAVVEAARALMHPATATAGGADAR